MKDMDVAGGREAARYCGIRLLAQMKAACGGDLGRVQRVVKLGGFVCSLPQNSDADIPKVINGCSDLLVEVLGEAGKHARFAVGSRRCRAMLPSKLMRLLRYPNNVIRYFW